MTLGTLFEDLSKFTLFCPYWTNQNPHHPSIFPTKFGWNWPSGSWEEVVQRKKLTLAGWIMVEWMD